MRGAIAAGHPVTAEVGARVLAAGGNAVDACVAAGFASWVAESPLTGPGGGGFMLVHRDGRARLLDCFVAVPGLGVTNGQIAEVEEARVVFEGENSQEFRIGVATAAVPGTAAGLEAAHRAYGSLPWPELVAPAVALARTGVELTPPQVYLHQVLDPMLRYCDDGRAVYGHPDPLAAGDRLVMTDLASTLEQLGDAGAGDLYHGELAAELLLHVRELGGAITAEDLAAYRPIWRRPIRSEFRAHELVSNPPPASGGLLVAHGLQLLNEGEVSPDRLIEAMRAQDRLRRRRLTRRLLTTRGTTHISVVDAEGTAASFSASTGTGSGVIVPGTGIHLNNMLGEKHLLPSRTPRAGGRLTGFMAPSLALESGRPRLVLGSAGSERLHGAIMQVVANVLARGMSVGEAIEHPRIHVDGENLHREPGADVEDAAYTIVQWQDRNLYFGGVSAVELHEDGSVGAAGDPRRGGAGIVVE